MGIGKVMNRDSVFKKVDSKIQKIRRQIKHKPKGLAVASLGNPICVS